jgi:hypothetical protein
LTGSASANVVASTVDAVAGAHDRYSCCPEAAAMSSNVDMVSASPQWTAFPNPSRVLVRACSRQPCRLAATAVDLGYVFPTSGGTGRRSVRAIRARSRYALGAGRMLVL